VKRDLKKSFGKVLKQLREEEGYSQDDLAELADVNRTYISDLERGVSYPTLNIVYKFADVFKMRPSELVEKVDEEMGT
jgi:transcriptional regulator with XRE-family HTH domain